MTKLINDIYHMDPHDVHIVTFKDGRIFDDSAKGYDIQRYYAKKHYRKWLAIIRQSKQWRHFRKDRRYTEEE